MPHAGWTCSGAIAGQTLAELARLNGQPPRVVVVFGAVHSPIAVDRAVLDPHRAWQVPGGQTVTASELAEQLRTAPALFSMDERLHRTEHAIEVELPLIQAAWPTAELLPIEVPLIDTAERIGRETAAARFIDLANGGFPGQQRSDALWPELPFHAGRRGTGGAGLGDAE